jgi:hypothetical protein
LFLRPLAQPLPKTVTDLARIARPRHRLQRQRNLHQLRAVERVGAEANLGQCLKKAFDIGTGEVFVGRVTAYAQAHGEAALAGRMKACWFFIRYADDGSLAHGHPFR